MQILVPSVIFETMRAEKFKVPQISDAPTFLTVRQAAQRLNASMPYVRKLVNSQMISSLKIGDFLRIPESEIERIIAEATRSAVK